ncbi:MAG: hypothetical protein GF308_17105 [Candidatus Heimdallarchaeota archaeon]|nr:hypothetical protein [Candidatus Heimdallarchaeota archaeon]
MSENDRDIQKEEEEEYTIPEVPATAEEPTIPEVPATAEEPTIPEVPQTAETEESTETEVKTEETFEADRYGFTAEEVKEKPKIPYFWIGLGAGIIVALITEILFSIPFWVNGASRPDLLYPEIIIILIAIMLPGLLTRSIQKGLLGGAIIFIIAFGLPFFTLIFGTQLLNPLAPLFSSTSFALQAFTIFKGLFGGELPFTEDQITNIQKWVWILDLILLFILVVIVVTLSAWLIKNITLPKKKPGNWVAIPLLSIGLIIFAIFVPIIFSATSGVIQASTAFLAGSYKFSEAYSTIEEESGTLSTEEIELINQSLDDASYWFSVSETNYQGLKNIGVIRFAAMVSGEYGPLIEQGDQMALAAFSFSKGVVPLFNGLINLRNSLNNATENMANFGSSSQGAEFVINEKGEIIIQQDELELENLKETILEAIRNIEAAQKAIEEGQAQEQLEQASTAFEEIDLSEIDLEKIDPKIAALVEEIQANIVQYQNKTGDYQNAISYAIEVLEPTKYLLWTSYNTVVGNYYMKQLEFNDAASAFTNALNNLTLVDPESFTLPEELEIEFLNKFSGLITDVLGLLDPVLNEELAVAQTLLEIDYINQEFVNSNFDATVINWDTTTTYLSTVSDNANLALTFGQAATDKLTEIQDKINAGTYEELEDEGRNFITIVTKNFDPTSFGNKTVYLSNAVASMVQGCSSAYDQGNFTIGYSQLQNGVNNLTIANIPEVEIPYFRDYLTAWFNAITAIKDVLYQVVLDEITEAQSITAIVTILETLDNAISGTS